MAGGGGPARGLTLVVLASAGLRVSEGTSQTSAPLAAVDRFVREEARRQRIPG